MPRRSIPRVPLALLVVLTAACSPAGHDDGAIETVTLPRADSPLIALRLLFQVGSMHDPVGKEGLAALTGMMVGNAGTAEHAYGELIDLLYPMAAAIEVATDREVTVISGLVHRETLTEYTDLLTAAVLRPGFDEGDFNRNKEQLMSYLTTTLRATNDELLGLEAIQQAVFRNHPYESSPAGTIEGLYSITLDDVRSFYQQHYTRANLLLGIAGGYSEDYLAILKTTLSALPSGEVQETLVLPEAAAVEGRHFILIEKETDSVGIHIAHALPVNRSDPDFYPLLVANSFLGEHRAEHGRLTQQLRGERGLNDGVYSYLEYWHLPPFSTTPKPGYPRQQQYLSIWLRPVLPTTAHFALRNAIYELNGLVERGLTQEEFELTRAFLANYSKLWAQTLAERLAVLMDSFYYGMPYYIDEIDSRLDRLTVDDVNRALKQYLQTANLHVVMVTDSAAAVKQYLETDRPSPMRYSSEADLEVLEVDEIIQALPLNPASIRIVPVGEMFQG